MRVIQWCCFSSHGSVSLSQISSAGAPAFITKSFTSVHLMHSSLLLSPPGGLSAGQPDSKLPGAAVRPPSLAPPVGGYLPGTHLAELWPGTLVWGSRQRPREALHSAFRSHSRGETSSVARVVSNTRKSLEMIKTFVWGKRKSSTA